MRLLKSFETISKALEISKAAVKTELSLNVKKFITVIKCKNNLWATK